ncbi:hypothetical protein Chor_010725 [Crotalus horridus]
MPETQNRCEFKRSSLEVGLGAADDVLGKRKVCVSGSNGDCLLESKKSRSESPKGATELLVALATASKASCPSIASIFHFMGQIPGRKFEPCAHAECSRQEMSHPPPLLSPQNAPHIALGPHLRPPFLGVPSALCQTPGYGFLQPAQAEIFARQQEMLRKQNLARLEMSAEIIRQKELENLHRQRLLATDPMGLHPGLPPDHPALRSLHDIPEGHPLRDELSRRNAMLVLRHNNAPLLSLNPQGVPTASTTPPKEQSTRRGTRKAAHSRCEVLGQSEPKDLLDSRPPDSNHEEMKDSDSEAEATDEKPDALKAENSGGVGEVKECKEVAKTGEGAKDLGEVPAGQNTPCSSSSAELPSYLLGPTMGKSEVKLLPTASLPPPQPLPFGFPYTMSPYFHAGTMGGLFLDGEESPATTTTTTTTALQDISKWTVEDVCSFVSCLSGCAEYTQVFRDQAIDGETLPLLTEEHLLNHMGLKLGPALKIRSQVEEPKKAEQEWQDQRGRLQEFGMAVAVDIFRVPGF